MERPPICAANAEIVVQLSAAAIDGDHPRVRELLGDLLRCRTPGTDQDLSPVLQPLEDLLLLLHSMALTDELTGLQNRRGFLHRAARLLDLAARKLHGALLIYVDVDNLKNVNDSSGHEAGDDLLRRAAQVLRDVSGDHAVIGRLGGDEFAVLDESANGGRSHHMLRRIQNAVEACNASGKGQAVAAPQVHRTGRPVTFEDARAIGKSRASDSRQSLGASRERGRAHIVRERHDHEHQQSWSPRHQP
jgi:diguanylate cyclase (GGDEF)-like protein